MINVGNIVSLKFSLFLRTWSFGGKETRLRWLCLRRCQLDFSKRKKWKPRKKFWPDSESGLCTRTQFRLLSSERSRRWTWRRRSTSSSARWRPDCNPTNPNPLDIIHSNFFIFIFNLPYFLILLMQLIYFFILILILLILYNTSKNLKIHLIIQDHSQLTQCCNNLYPLMIYCNMHIPFYLNYK